MKRTKDELDPAEAVEAARNELEAAEQELASIDPNRGSVDDVLNRRRALTEKIELLKERLTLAQDRADEADFNAKEAQLAGMQNDLAELNDQIEAEGERVTRVLREYLNERDATRAGFASVQVGELRERKSRLEREAMRLEDAIRDRRAKRALAAAQEPVEKRKRLLQGEAVAVELQPWVMSVVFGHADELLAGFRQFSIPAMRHQTDDEIVFALVPPDRTPGQVCGSFDLFSERPLKCGPGDLPPQLRAVFDRSK